jgi:osmotically-inducible protein OsmY
VSNRASLLVTAFTIALATMLLGGCLPLIAVGAAGVAMVATDPRSSGAQFDDQSVEFKLTTTVGSKWGADVHLNVTSYNGNVLLSGEAPTAEIRREIVRLAQSTDRARNVYDELVVGPTTDLGARSNDTYITSKVKTRLLDAESVKGLYVKVVTERRVVYLMGIVPREQAATAANVAATTDGVARVVKLFEYTN